MIRSWKTGYRMLRAVWRWTRRVLFETVRRITPVSSRFGGPKEAFSAYLELEEHRLEGRVLLPRQDTPPAIPGGLRELCRMGQDVDLDWPIFWTRHREVHLASVNLLPVDTAKRVCNEAMYRQGTKFWRDANLDYLALPPAKRLEGPWTSLVSLYGRHFYHWIHDELPRLWALEDFPADTRILIPGPAPAYIRETLGWLGLSDRAVETDGRHFVVEDFYFSAPTAMWGLPNPFGLRFLRERLLPFAAVPAASPLRRIYLQRSGKTRGIANEDEVRDLLVQKGFSIVDPEQLSLAQQMRLFMEAEVICGLHGGAFTNMVWCSPGCQVVEFLGEGFLNGGYEGIAQCLDLQHRFLICPDDGQLRVKLDLARLKTTLAQIGI